VTQLYAAKPLATVYEPNRFEHILDVIILSMLFIGVVLFSFPLIEIALEWH